MNLQVILPIESILANHQGLRLGLGRVPLPREGEEKEVPEFVEDVICSLKGVYDDMRQKLNEDHQRNKSRYDEKVAGSNLPIGDRVWLYNPAVKQIRTKKLSSLWHGLYTLIDRVGTLTYQILLIGSSNMLGIALLWCATGQE